MYMFYKIVINNRKKLLHLLKLKSISEKHEKNHTLMFKVLRSICIFESTTRFSYEHVCIDIGL